MRPTRARIDLSAIQHNLQVLKRAAPGCPIMAVLKANAYGHGARAVASVLASEADAFAVAFLEEALELRESGCNHPIVILEGPQRPEDLSQAVKSLTWVLHEAEQCTWMEAVKTPQRFWLKANVGMNRLGFFVREIPERIAWSAGRRSWTLAGVLSHYACADGSDADFAREEQGRVALLRQSAPDQVFSTCNSAGVLAGLAQQGDWLRPGIALYGSSPFPGRSRDDLGLRAAMILESALITIRSLQPGDVVGYGGTWRATGAGRMGIVPVGYADGFLRSLSSCGMASINGMRVPVIGRVSMDMIALDLSQVPEVRQGDRVELWGRELPVDEQAAAAGSLGYELLAGLTDRVPRVYQAT